MKEWNLRGITQVEPAPVPTASAPTDPPHPFRALLDQVPALLWTTDETLRLTSCVGAALAELGLGPNQLVGTKLFDLFEDQGPRNEAVAAHRRALLGASTAFEIDWGNRRFHAAVAPLHDGSFTVIGAVCIALEKSTGPAVVSARSRRLADSVA